MKKYDYDYFQGKDLQYPIRPTKPVLGAATAAAARAYADSLEAYEHAHRAYEEEYAQYRSALALRGRQLRDQIRVDYDITEAQFDLLWDRAYEDCHSEGLPYVVDFFEELHQLAVRFAALEALEK